jgi:ABC-type multidrug transport system ATPase subunit
VLGNIIDIKTTITRMPEKKVLLSPSKVLMDQTSSIFYFVFLFPLPMIMFSIVYEKTERIREMMKLSGLKMRYYWIVIIMFNFILYIVLTGCLTYVLAAILQYSWALHSNVLLILCYYLCATVCIIGFAIFLSSLCNSTLLSLVLGYIIALFSTSVCSTIDQFLIQKTGDQFIFLLLLPPMAINHSFQSGILNMCNNANCPGWSTFITWNPVLKGMIFMLLDGVLCLVMGLYIDAVFPGKWGVARHPLFFLSPFRKLFKKQKIPVNIEAETTLLIQVKDDENYIQDDDVTREEQRINNIMNSQDQDQIHPIIIDHMKKSYGGTKLAVNDLSFAVEKGTCFGLLGPNGAGKTTLISILCGLFPPTSGTAFINGNDIRYDMPQVHKSLGLCPQHEIVWNDLTVEEHLLFYARIKGANKNNEKILVKNAMESVGLNDLSDNSLASQLSGGMRKRLSIAISLVSDPSIVLLDEPTTGLDPTSKRQIWDILSKAKEKHSLILTTHSLEEADVLSDKIGIMSQGKLKCIGTSMHLKNKFGSGYRLSVNYVHQNEEQVDQFIHKLCNDDCVINSRFAGNMVYDLPKSIFVDISISDFMAELENGKANVGINDWTFAQSTLEDVFMNIIREDEGVEH